MTTTTVTAARRRRRATRWSAIGLLAAGLLVIVPPGVASAAGGAPAQPVSSRGSAGVGLSSGHGSGPGAAHTIRSGSKLDVPVALSTLGVAVMGAALFASRRRVAGYVKVRRFRSALRDVDVISARWSAVPGRHV